eukprot:199202-Hanusia_phi.AAC.5
MTVGQDPQKHKGYMNNRIAFADVGKELVSQTRSLTCSFHDACNIHELHCRRNGLHICHFSGSLPADRKTFTDSLILARTSSLGSGTGTIPTLGSMVQKGKFAASAVILFKRALNKVDFPTEFWLSALSQACDFASSPFGRPTIPVCSFAFKERKPCLFAVLKLGTR